MIPPEQEEVLWIFDFVGQEETNRFNGFFASENRKWEMIFRKYRSSVLFHLPLLIHLFFSLFSFIQFVSHRNNEEMFDGQTQIAAVMHAFNDQDKI